MFSIGLYEIIMSVFVVNGINLLTVILATTSIIYVAIMNYITRCAGWGWTYNYELTDEDGNELDMWVL